MNKLIFLAALPFLGLAACNEPNGDTADLAPDQIAADVGPDEPAGDGGAPGLANVQAAIDEACPALRARVGTALCEADGLDLDTFVCEYAFAQDPEGTEREVTLVQPGEGVAWQVQEEPDFCGSLDRANIMADLPDPDVEIQPID